MHTPKPRLWPNPHRERIIRERAAAAAAAAVASVVSDSVRPHRWQPTRLHPLWDSQGKSPGVGCHFLLQRMKVKSESEVAQSCPILNPMDCSPPGSSFYGIFQARVMEWVAITSEREGEGEKHAYTYLSVLGDCKMLIILFCKKKMFRRTHPWIETSHK